MTSQMPLQAKAFQAEKAFSGAILKDPSAYPETLIAVDYALGPSYEVAIAGNSNAPATQAMLRAAETPFLPDKVVLLRPTESPSPGIVHLADYTRYESAMDGGPTAYVCLKYNCKLPTNDTGRMLQLLGAKSQ